MHDLARLTFRNPVSLAYLALVTVAALFVTVDMLFVTHDDASPAGVWLFLLAAPTVFVFLIGGDLLASSVADSAAFLYPRSSCPCCSRRTRSGTWYGCCATDALRRRGA